VTRHVVPTHSVPPTLTTHSVQIFDELCGALPAVADPELTEAAPALAGAESAPAKAAPAPGIPKPSGEAAQQAGASEAAKAPAQPAADRGKDTHAAAPDVSGAGEPAAAAPAEAAKIDAAAERPSDAAEGADFSSLIAKEVSNLKDKSQHRFRLHHTGVKTLLFLEMPFARNGAGPCEVRAVWLHATRRVPLLAIAVQARAQHLETKSRSRSYQLMCCHVPHGASVTLAMSFQIHSSARKMARQSGWLVNAVARMRDTHFEVQCCPSKYLSRS
jgi:hypothetical protein